MSLHGHFDIPEEHALKPECLALATIEEVPPIVSQPSTLWSSPYPG